MKLKAPFPWMGGKSAVADLIWERLGDVQNFIVPFYGSGAELLGRPEWHTGRIETVTDINHYIVNFWRAIAKNPKAVARYADNPVSEADLHARHRWLVLSAEAEKHKRRIVRDPDYSNARIAGWWAWGQSTWIGGGWCADYGRTAGVGQRATVPRLEGGSVVNQKKMPDLSRPVNRALHTFKSRKPKRMKPKNAGVNELGGGQTSMQKRRPRLMGSPGEPGTGVNWHVKAATNNQGLNCYGGRPQLGDAYDIGRGVNSNWRAGTCKERREFLEEWFELLADRLRLVRVMYGHWARICQSETTTTRLGLTGISLYPPYPTHTPDGKPSRDGHLYHGDDRSRTDAIRDEVFAYCLEHGDDPMFRIAVCGYDTDGYALLERHGWDCVAWKAQGGYGNRIVATGGKNTNKARERIWFSPYCLKPSNDLFANVR